MALLRAKMGLAGSRIRRAVGRVAFGAAILAGLLGSPATALVLSDDEKRKLASGDAIVRVEEAPSPADGEISAAIDIAASPAQVWAVLHDCAGAPSFMENLKSCRVLDDAGDGRWDVREHVVQWTSFLPQVRSVFRSDYVTNRSIRFQKVEGDLAHLDGEWRLEPVAGGSKTRLTYTVQVGFHALVPSFMVRNALEADIPQFLGMIRKQVMNRRAG